MALLDALLFVLYEELLPHVLEWKDENIKRFQINYLNKGNKKWDITFVTLFKIMDSFNESKFEGYLKEANYERLSKGRFTSNIDKFISRKELVNNYKGKKDDYTIHVLDINLSDEEITQRIENLSELVKNKIRSMVTEDLEKASKGRKRALQNPTPSTSSPKKLKSNTSSADLPSNSTQVIPIEEINVNSRVTTPVFSVTINGVTYYLTGVCNQNSSRMNLRLICDIEITSSQDVDQVLPIANAGSSSSHQIEIDKNLTSAIQSSSSNISEQVSDPSEESFYPPSEIGPPRSCDPIENITNTPPMEIMDDSVNQFSVEVSNSSQLNETNETHSPAEEIQNYSCIIGNNSDQVSNPCEDHFLGNEDPYLSALLQQLDDLRNQEQTNMQNFHSLPDVRNHEMELGNLELPEISFDLNDLTEFNIHTGSF